MIEFVREIAVYGLGDLVFRVIGYGSFLIYARIFLPEEFGVLSLVITIGSIIGIFQELGMNNATQRFYLDPHLSKESRSRLVTTALTILLGWSVFLTLSGLILFYSLQEIFTSRYGIRWSFVALTLLCNVPAQLLMFCQNMLRIYFSPWKFTFLSFYKNLVGILFSLVFILVLKMGLLGFFLGECCALVLSIPICVFFIRKDLDWCFDEKIAQELLRFGYPFIFAGMGFWLFVSMDRWMLSELSSNVEVGLYSVAGRFGMIILFANEVFGRAWAPHALKLYAENPRYREVYSRVFSCWFFAMTLLGGFLSLFSSEIIRVSTPEVYWRSAAPLSILAIGIVFSSTTQITALGISLERQTKLFSFGSWGAALINFVLNLLLIPRMGAVGSAFATLVSYIVLNSYYLYWMQRLHPIVLEVKKLGACVLINLLVLTVALNAQYFATGFGLIALKAGICLSVVAVGIGLGIFGWADLIKFFRSLWPGLERRCDQTGA